jgi:mannose-6-phosphate isomerase-like protein (cupin superfamily)
VRGNASLSMAEALVAAGQQRRLHRHRHSEEICRIIASVRRMLLGKETPAIRRSDTICIAPGMLRYLENAGAEKLRILCCGVPPYAGEDTALLGRVTNCRTSCPAICLRHSPTW